MFSSLRSRLWLTYFLLAGLVIVVLGAALWLFLLRSQYPARQELQRLRLSTALVAVLMQNQRQTLSDNLPYQSLVDRADTALDMRVVILDRQGEIRADSRSAESGPAAGWRRLAVRGSERLPSFRDARGKTWLYAVRELENGLVLVTAVPRPKLPVFQILRNEFSAPFLEATVVALALSLLLAYAISRWVSSPLQRMAAAARALSGTNQSQPVLLEGPTEVRTLGQAFNDMAARVQASQLSQRNFVANVSHELKTPLTSIQGFAQAILDGAADTPQTLHQAAEVIYSESTRMNSLVLDLLDLARLESGSFGFASLPVDLNRLLTNTLDRFSIQAQQKQVQIKNELGELPLITGDPDRLSQVFNNLIDNALKYTPSDCEVVVGGRGGKEQVEIWVSDTGPGIPAEDLERIFERFYQTDPARKGGERRGAGLGLAIAREIVVAHGGRIWVENKSPGQGSIFVVKLSIAPAAVGTVAGIPENRNRIDCRRQISPDLRS